MCMLDKFGEYTKDVYPSHPSFIMNLEAPVLYILPHLDYFVMPQTYSTSDDRMEGLQYRAFWGELHTFSLPKSDKVRNSEVVW